MDTAHALITEYPGREVNLVAGPGTYFTSRDRMFPNGIRQRWTGTLPSGLFTEAGLRFDGTNEAEVQNWLRANYCTWLTPDARNYFAGILSESEKTTIAAGLHEVVMDHLVDVVDRHSGTELVFRSGATRSIPPDSWIVNCTGYLLRADHPYEPYVSGRRRGDVGAATVDDHAIDVGAGVLHDPPDVPGQAS